MGPNGSGKTTLLKILLGEEEPTAGLVRRGHLVQVGYLDQHLSILDESKSVLRAVWPDPDETINEQKMRDLLGSFGLHGKIVEQPLGSLSGGERSRAALARLTVEGANVLVLDEPTNHLDLWACDSLEQALKSFEGTVLCVSHDRYFLNRVAEMLIVFEGPRPEVVFGNYDTYELLRASRETNEASPARHAGGKEKRTAVATDGPRPEKPKKKRKYPYRKVADLESDIHTAEAKVAFLENALQDVELYKDKDRFRQTLADLEALKAQLPDLYAHWEEAVELNG
jgi:ATP-binding cassette subfamily F protein 3